MRKILINKRETWSSTSLSPAHPPPAPPGTNPTRKVLHMLERDNKRLYPSHHKLQQVFETVFEAPYKSQTSDISSDLFPSLNSVEKRIQCIIEVIRLFWLLVHTVSEVGAGKDLYSV